MRGHIYGGIDGDTREMRYVGKTKGPVGGRPRDHENAARRGWTFPIYDWLRKRQRQSRPVEWVVIEYLTDDDPRELDELEIGWIAYFRDIGCRLVNATSGGDGGSPTEGTRAKISAAKKGQRLSAQHRARLSEVQIGKVLSPSHRAALSAALKGRPRPTEVKAKISAGCSRRTGPRPCRQCGIHGHYAKTCPSKP